MIRTLLATTALAAVIAVPVIAQDSSSAMDSSMSSMESSSMMMSSEMPMDSSSMMSSEPMDTMSSEMPMDTMSSEPMDTDTSMMSSQMTQPFDIVTGYTQIPADRFATRLIGQPVYDSTATDANHLGDINDLIIGENGSVIAATIGVGGFLGIGEKQVAVSYSALEWTTAADNTKRFVLNTTVEELTAAPDFVVVEDQPVAGDAMAPAPADPNAMAPADTSSAM